jgi:N-acetylglucosamine-6-phosphate deacetylase
MKRFDGKVALLTGAGGYIGGTSAKRFAAEGAKVFVCDYTMDIARRTVDAIRAAGLPEGTKTKIGSLKNGLPVIVEDGVAKTPDRQSFAGSAATYDRLYRTMGEAVGGDRVALSRMTALTPARALGLTDRGEIACGKRADLVLMNEENQITHIFLGGNEI